MIPVLQSTYQALSERGQNRGSSGDDNNTKTYYQQCPAGSRKIPGSRDWTWIPIPGFLKIKSRDFSGFWYSTEDDVYKDFYLFQTASGSFLYSQNLSKCFDFLLYRPWQIFPFTSQWRSWRACFCTRSWKPCIFCQNIYFLSPISLNSERFFFTITQLSTFSGSKRFPKKSLVFCLIKLKI